MARRFLWRLETLLKSKRRAEDQQQQNMAKTIAKLQKELAERTRIVGIQATCRQDLKQLQSGRLNIADLAQINAHLEILDLQHRRAEGRIKFAQSETDSAREKLAQAVRERQVLENLRQQDYQIFQKAERKRDQAMMDELAARRKWHE